MQFELESIDLNDLKKMSRRRETNSEQKDNHFLCIARVLMAFNLLISWYNIILLIHCVAMATLIQLIWFFKPTKKWYLSSAVISFVAGIGCLYVGIELFPSWDRLTGTGTIMTQYQPILPEDDAYDDDDYYDNILGEVVDIKRFDSALEESAKPPCEYGTTTILRSISCDETIVGAIAAFCSGAMWFLTIDFILRFLDTTLLELVQEYRERRNNESLQDDDNNSTSSFGDGFETDEDLLMSSEMGLQWPAATDHDRTDETARMDVSVPMSSNDTEHDENHGGPNTILQLSTDEDGNSDNDVAADEMEDSGLLVPVNSIEIPSEAENV